MQRWIHSITETTGRMVSLLVIAMVVVTSLVVVLRYAFGIGWIWLQELTTWMHAMVLLLGAAYTLKANEHVRVDIFYRRLSKKRQRVVEVLGFFFLLLPSCGLLFWLSAEYAWKAWVFHETSYSSGGLGYPFVPIAKTTLCFAMLLLILQAAAQLKPSKSREH